MRWIRQHGIALVGLFLSGLYVYLQLVVWKKHGDDLMLTAGNIAVTVVLWITLLIAIGKYWRRDSTPNENEAVDARPTRQTYELSFAYLPASPLQNGWTRAYGDTQTVPTFNAPSDAVATRGLSIEVNNVYAIDKVLPSEAQAAVDVELAVKGLDGDAQFYLLVNVSSHDGSQRDAFWLNIKLGAGQPRQHSDSPKEFVVPVTPEALKNGWVRMVLRLPALVRAAMGQRGWVYDSVQRVRLRGNISVSPMKFLSRD